VEEMVGIGLFSIFLFSYSTCFFIAAIYLYLFSFTLSFTDYFAGKKFGVPNFYFDIWKPGVAFKLKAGKRSKLF
jgi:hypothetical protein